jgi:hypothetical protein
MKIKVIQGLPILEMGGEGIYEYAVVRDRQPDSGWSQLRKKYLNHYNIDEVEETEELYKTLVEDMFYFKPDKAYDILNKMGFLKREHDCLH